MTNQFQKSCFLQIWRDCVKIKMKFECKLLIGLKHSIHIKTLFLWQHFITMTDRLMKLGNKLFSHSTGPFWGKTRRKKRPVKVRLAQCGILKRAQNILLRLHLDSLAEKHYERKMIALKMTVAGKV